MADRDDSLLAGTTPKALRLPEVTSTSSSSADARSKLPSKVTSSAETDQSEKEEVLETRHGDQLESERLSPGQSQCDSAGGDPVISRDDSLLSRAACIEAETLADEEEPPNANNSNAGPPRSSVVPPSPIKVLTRSPVIREQWTGSIPGGFYVTVEKHMTDDVIDKEALAARSSENGSEELLPISKLMGADSSGSSSVQSSFEIPKASVSSVLGGIFQVV